MPDAILRPPAPDAMRTGPNPMETHVKVIGILDIVFGCISALAALLLLLAFGIGSAATQATQGSGTPTWVPGFLAGLGIVFAVFVGLFAVIFILAGVKLVGRRRSGKVLGIIVACVQLLGFPLGTALGIYSLVILTRKETDQLLVN